jgi:rod shape-determining protein MreC
LREYTKTWGFKALIAIVVLSIIAAVITFNLHTSFLSSAIGFVTTPMQQLSANATNAAKEMSPAGKKSYEELEQENKELQNRLNEVLPYIVEYYDIKRENEQYSKFLELKSNNKDYKFASASVIGRDPAEMFYGITLDQGSLSEISLYDPVITDKGLVGWVSAVYPTYCKVTTLLSPDTNVSVVDQATMDSGVINGSMAACDIGQPFMKFVSPQNNIKKNDIIVTSGMGGIYPSKLLVGQVDSIEQMEGSMDLKVKISPYQDLKDVSQVFVITSFLGKGTNAIEGSAK